MADREKLIELINDHTCLEEKDNCAEECAACLADYLIANGVTIQPLTDCKQPVTDNNVGCKWISVKDRTPTEADGTVWVCLADVFPYNEKEPYIDAKHDRRITEAFYSQFSKRWYKDGAFFPDGIVTHWMEKPQPPKGECP